jgi:transcriptional regulator with XRE-family HTH domain
VAPETVASIKARIKAELRADGCTQKDLARYLGLSEKHVSQMLTGRVTGTLPLIEAMASAVGLSLGITTRKEGTTSE